MVFGVAIAFPGTKMFHEYFAEGLVKSFDWDEYHARTSEPLFNHRSLTHQSIQEHLARAHRDAMWMNPAFLARRLRRGVRTGEFFWDVYYGIKFVMAPASSLSAGHDYYARDRWPRHDYLGEPLRIRDYQVVRSGPRQSSPRSPASVAV